MSAISINLLPEELTATGRVETQNTKLTRLSIAVLLSVILLTSTTLLVRILQNRSLALTTQQLNDARNKVSALKNQEGLVFYLKQRLGLIGTLANQETPQTKSFNLINNLLPAGISISAMSVNKNGDITLSVISATSDVMSSLFNNLTDPLQNQGRISRVNLDSFSKGNNGLYRADLTIKVS